MGRLQSKNVYFVLLVFITTSCESLRKKSQSTYKPAFGTEETGYSDNSSADAIEAPAPAPVVVAGTHTEAPPNTATPPAPAETPPQKDTPTPPSPTYNTKKKTMIIGDSLSSSAGLFGTNLAKHLSQNGTNACLHSVSGSRFDHWTNDNFQSSMYGATYRNFINGNASGSSDTSGKSKLPQNWSLSQLLNNNPCGSKGSVDELIVQLGSNHSPGEDPTAHLKKVLSIAHTSGVKEVKFILPPRGRSDPNKFKNFNNKAIAFLSGKQGISYFDSSSEVALKESDFRDEDHFWYSKNKGDWENSSEAAWLRKVQSWALQETPTTRQTTGPLLTHN